MKGIKGENYDLQSKYDKLEKDYDKLLKDYKALDNRCEKLVEDWIINCRGRGEWQRFRGQDGTAKYKCGCGFISETQDNYCAYCGLEMK